MHGEGEGLLLLGSGQGASVGVLDVLLEGEGALQGPVTGGDDQGFGFPAGDGKGITGDGVSLGVHVEGVAGGWVGFFKIVGAGRQLFVDGAVGAGAVRGPLRLAVFGKQVKGGAGHRGGGFCTLGGFFQLDELDFEAGGAAGHFIFGLLAEALPAQGAGDEGGQDQDQGQGGAEGVVYGGAHGGASFLLGGTFEWVRVFCTTAGFCAGGSAKNPGGDFSPLDFWFYGCWHPALLGCFSFSPGLPTGRDGRR